MVKTVIALNATVDIIDKLSCSVAGSALLANVLYGHGSAFRD